MVFAEISKSLIDKLDVLIPNWRSLVDQSVLKWARESGAFDEEWLIKHLKDQLGASVYQEITEKGKEINSEVISDGEGSDIASDALRELGAFISYKADSFLEVTLELERLFKEFFWDNTGEDSNKLDENIRKSIDETKQEVEVRFKAQEQEIINFFQAAPLIMKSFNDPGKEDLKSLLESQMEKFTKENKRAAQVQQSFLDEDFGVLLKREASNFGGSHVASSAGEKKNLASELEKIIDVEVDTQRKLRTDSVNEVLSKAIGKSSSEELIEFFDESEDLTPRHKNILAAVIDSGYLLVKEDQIDFEEKRGSVRLARHAFDYFSFDNISLLYEIAKHLNLVQARNKAQLDAIFDDGVYRFCNGGWWAAFAHIGTAGFCSGWTLAANLHAFLMGKMMDTDSLLLAVNTIIFFVTLPFKVNLMAFLKTWKLKKLITKATEKEIRKRIKKKFKSTFKKTVVRFLLEKD